MSRCTRAESGPNRKPTLYSCKPPINKLGIFYSESLPLSPLDGLQGFINELFFTGPSPGSPRVLQHLLAPPALQPARNFCFLTLNYQNSHYRASFSPVRASPWWNNPAWPRDGAGALLPSIPAAPHPNTHRQTLQTPRAGLE